MPSAEQIIATIQAHADPVQAQNLQRFFKTGAGQYGEGDVFWGVKVPVVRRIAKAFTTATLPIVNVLLDHAVHEVRLCALLLLVEQFSKASEIQRKNIIDFYLYHAERVNNWDLVDLSVRLLGTWLIDKDRALLDELAASPILWKQRMAVVATHTFIRLGDFEDILRLSQKLMHHPHDLIHKALGWMLREVGKQDRAVLSAFLHQHRPHMPRTMLRYAIEHYPEPERKAWLQA
ncbi:MAG: DNA alkylation repair protein [Desulfovibrionaceae bacterium]